MTMMKLGGFAALAACLAFGAVGCDGDDDDAQAYINSQPAGSAVHVTATITLANSSITKIQLKARADETLILKSGIKMTLAGADHTSKIQSDPAGIQGAQTTAAIPVTTTGENKLVIESTNGSGVVTLANTGSNGKSVVIGRIEIALERKADGTLIAPTEAAVSIPTSTSTLKNGATFKGLPVGTLIEASYKSNTGTTLSKSATVTATSAASPDGTQVADLAGGVDGQAFNGPNSALTLRFVKP